MDWGEREEIRTAQGIMHAATFVRGDRAEVQKPKSVLHMGKIVEALDVYLPPVLDPGEVWWAEYLLKHSHYRVAVHYTEEDLQRVTNK